MSDDLRFPIGRFSFPGSVSATERARHIAAIEATPAALAEAVAGLDDIQLDTPYREEGWSVRQVVHHLADSHINSYTRIRLTLTEDVPTIRPYFEDRWATLTDARTGPIDLSLALLEALHARWVLLLQGLEEAHFARRLVHPEHGELTLDQLTAMYGWHGPHHVAHITSLRQRRGW